MRFSDISNLTESSRGLLFRKAGDPFINVQNPKDTITFDKAELFPPRGKYPDYDTFVQAVDDVEARYKKITWTNKSNAGTLAFGIVTMKNKTGKPLYYGRFFREILPDMAGLWKNDQIPGYSLAIKSSTKSRSGLKPTDILPAGSQFKNATDIVNAAAGSGKLDQALINGLSMVPKGQLPVFAVQKELNEAIRDDLGEVISAMALWQGMIGGQAEDARKFLLKNQPWNTCSINFTDQKNSGLIDSILRPQRGVAVGISSKGDVGAKASVTNIWSGIDLLRKSGQEQVVNKHAEAVEILEIIKTYSARVGPVVLGTKFGLCTMADGELIEQAIATGMQTYPTRSPKWKNIGVLMSKLQPRDIKSNYNIGYHALAGLAKLVADKVNADPKFSAACLEFLNSSPLIQIHTHTAVTKEGVKVTGFDSIWPPQFKGKIMLMSGKSYYATGVINKFAFGFN